MSWVLFVLIAALIAAVVNIWDKHVVSDELRDPKLCSAVYGITFFASSIVIFAFKKISLTMGVIEAVAITAGLANILAAFFYYKSLEKDDVSDVVPLFMLTPVMVLILGIFLLGEEVSTEKYIGTFLLVVGAIVLSYKKAKQKRRIDRFIIPVAVSILFYASRDILIRFTTAQYDFLSLFFWIGCGSFLASAVLLLFHHPHVFRKAKEVEGIEHLVIISILSIIAFLSFVKAISLTKVALVSAFFNTKVFMVLVLALFLSKHKPEIIKEHMESSTIERKIIGSMLMFAGAILIVI